MFVEIDGKLHRVDEELIHHVAKQVVSGIENHPLRDSAGGYKLSKFASDIAVDAIVAYIQYTEAKALADLGEMQVTPLSKFTTFKDRTNMSNVDNIVLIVSISDERTVDNINQWLDTYREGQRLVDVSKHAGGHKGMELCVFTGAFSHLPIDELESIFAYTAWVDPFNAMLIIRSGAEDVKILRTDDYHVSQNDE